MCKIVPVGRTTLSARQAAGVITTRCASSAISRHLVRIFAEHTRDRHCPFCGAKPLDEDGVLAIEEGHDRFRRWLGLLEDDQNARTMNRSS